MPRKSIVLGACIAVGLALPTVSSAQITAVCGSQDLLFHCTFNDGAKLVELCLSDQTISYSFGANANQPELSLKASVFDVDYVPYGWASNTIYESVQLYNGNTGYEVFSSVPRGENNAAAEGGITVTLPDQSRQTLTCDAGSVLPNDPLDGIGQLIQFAADEGGPLLARCLNTSSDATACIGIVQNDDVSKGRCSPSNDETECWRMEQTAWDAVLADAFQATFDIVLQEQGEAYANALRAAQDNWSTTRDLDCAVYWTLLFARDVGNANCNAIYAAKRIDFLRYVAGIADFQG